MNGNANECEVAQPSEPHIINTFLLLNRSMSSQDPSVQRVQMAARQKAFHYTSKADLVGFSSPYAFYSAFHDLFWQLKFQYSSS